MLVFMTSVNYDDDDDCDRRSKYIDRHYRYLPSQSSVSSSSSSYIHRECPNKVALCDLSGIITVDQSEFFTKFLKLFMN